MDTIEKFLNKYLYKFPKGYPDMNNEQDILLLKKLLKEDMDIDLEEEKKQIQDPNQLDMFTDEEIKNLVVSLDDPKTKKKILDILRKANRKEDIHDEEEKKRIKNDILEILTKEKNLASNYRNAIYRIALDYGESEKLLNYLKSPTVNNIPDSGTLLNDLFVDIPVSKELKEEIIELYGRSTGKGEVSLITFIKGCTARGGKKIEGKGDIILNGTNIEVKQGDKVQLVPFKISGYSIKPSSFLKNQTGLDFTSGERWPDTLQNFWKNGDTTTEIINKILIELYEGYVSPISQELKDKPNGLLNHIADELAKSYIEESKPILFISAKSPYSFKKINSFKDYQNLKTENLKISAFSDEFPRFSYFA